MDQKPSLDFKVRIKMDYSPIHGKGIFALEDILKDEVIEICPMVPLQHRMNYHHDQTIRDYCFAQICPCEECKKHGGHFLMVLGYGQVYNHHDDNNARISFSIPNGTALINANKDIKKGEEIFISYGENYFKSRSTQDVSTKVLNRNESSTSTENKKTQMSTPLPNNVFTPL
jgi:SET domain-containing protein